MDPPRCYVRGVCLERSTSWVDGKPTNHRGGAGQCIAADEAGASDGASPLNAVLDGRWAEARRRTHRIAASLAVLLVVGSCRYIHQHPTRDVLGAPEGTYHVDSLADAFNIHLNADGSFYGTSCGCDFQGYGVGRWRREGSRITFLPHAGERAVYWPREFHNKASIVGDLTHDGLVVREGKVEQRWVPGRLCAICGGDSLGPTGARMCPEPLPRDLCPES